MKVNPKLILHDSDKTQIDKLKKGTLMFWIWQKLVQKMLPDEELSAGIASSGIRVSETIRPDLYHALQDVAQALEIPEPLLYIENNVDTVKTIFAGGRIYLAINPEYLRGFPEHLYATLLVRECAHIYCGHMEERSIFTIALQILKALSSTVIGILAGPMEKILYLAQSNSHLTADRMAMIYNKGARELIEVCYLSAGHEEEITEDRLQAFIAQMMENKDKVAEYKTRKTLIDYGFMDGTCPTYAQRVGEALTWEETDDFKKSVAWFWEKEQAEEVKLFYSAEQLKGRKTDEVETALKESGITQIQFVENKGKQQDAVCGKVSSVMVAGRENFETNEWFPQGCEAVVFYDAK